MYKRQLLARQSEAWDPILDWAATRFDIRFNVTCGVMPVSQDDATLTGLRHCMDSMSDFQLTGFHDLVTLSGSYVIALAAAEKLHTGEHLWAVSRIDETWQTEQWGVDEEAAQAAGLKRAAFLHAEAFFDAA